MPAPQRMGKPSPFQQQRPMPPPHHHGRGINIPAGPVMLAVVVVLVIAGAYYLVTSQGSSTAITGAQNINVGTAGTVVTMGGSEYLMALSASYPPSNLAYVYVTKLPMFVNPIYNVSVSSAASTKLSTGKAGYANMQLIAVSITNTSSVELRVTPLDPSLGIAPDYSRIRAIQSYFGNGTVGESLIAVQGSNTTVATTTVPPVVSSGGTTVASSSTTTIAANNTPSRIMAALRNSTYYPVLLNLSSLYTGSSQCTQGLYNSAYIAEYSHAPQPPSDFPNQSQVIPTSLYYNITNAGSGNYDIVYYTNTVIFGSHQSAVTLTADVQTLKITNVTFAKSGVFQGFTGVGSLLAIYNRATKIGAPCGIEVP